MMLLKFLLFVTLAVMVVAAGKVRHKAPPPPPVAVDDDDNDGDEIAAPVLPPLPQAALPVPATTPQSEAAALWAKAQAFCTAERDRLVALLRHNATTLSDTGYVAFAGSLHADLLAHCGRRNIIEEVSQKFCGPNHHYLFVYDPAARFEQKNPDGTVTPLIPFELSTRTDDDHTPCGRKPPASKTQ